MTKKLLLLISFLALFIPSVAVAQTPSTQGTQFWLSFMRNGYRNSNSSNNKLILIASAKRACIVTVSNPNQNWQQSFSVADHDVSTFVVPDSRGYNDQRSGISNKGLYVTSTDTISLYIANEAENSYDAANVLPIEALGCQYMIQSNKSIGEQNGHYGENRASFLVVATEDDTRVQITPTCRTYDSHAAGDPYEVVLNRGECYHVINQNAGASSNHDGDFSGAWVTSVEDKPIAVFNGNCITSVPGGLSEGYDHVFEQAMAVDHWGKRFVVTSIYPAYTSLLEDLVKVTALLDNTTVTRDGTVLCRLNAGQSYTFMMNLSAVPSAFLEADNPIAVYVYNHSHQSSGIVYGDPSMVWISPVEQTIYEVTFSTFQAAKVEKHFVNVVCYTEHVAELTLDGTSVANSFSPVVSAPEFSFARIQVSQGAHILHCPGGFVAHVYGMGENEGYAYTVGSSAKILTKQLYVNDVLSSDYPEGYETCKNETVGFRVETNYEFDHVAWDFGDQTTDNGAEVTHRYALSGDFDVTAVVWRDIEGTVQAFDTLTTTIHVHPIVEHEMEPLSTCGTTTYTFHGVEYDVPGDYEVHFLSHYQCDSIVHLHLIQGSQTTFVLDPVVHCGPYEWFGTIYTETDHNLTHLVPNATPEGCDSLYVLDLTIAYPPLNTHRSLSSCTPIVWHGQLCDATNSYHHTFTTAEGCEYDSVLNFTLLKGLDVFVEADTCDFYEWMGTIYEEIGTHVYTKTMMGENGCEDHYQLTLTLHPSAPFTKIVGREHVAVATNFWPGEYLYQLDDSTGLDLELVHWELEGDPGWKMTPHGASCVIKTIGMGTATLHAWTEGYGDCDKEVSMTIRCTGYAVDEESQTPLEIYPNPARNVLFVKGEEMVEIALYNLLGQCLKTVSVQGNNLVEIGLEDCPPALYLVEVRTLHNNKTLLFSVIR